MANQGYPEKPKARFNAELVITFALPGVRSTSSGKLTGGSYQLENKYYEEQWVLHVNEENAADTADALQAVADEIRRVLEARK